MGYPATGLGFGTCGPVPQAVPVTYTPAPVPVQPAVLPVQPPPVQLSLEDLKQVS